MKAQKIPILILVILLIGSLVGGIVMTTEASKWNSYLDSIEQDAIIGNWASVDELLLQLNERWQSWQTYLHITISHDEIDSADTLFQLTRLHAAEKDTAALRVAVSQLRCQFSLLSEIGQLNLKNVL